MYENYNNRVKNFIIDMINPETQITMNTDIKNKKDILQKGEDKDIFIQKKPFIFKGYTTEKERIIEYIKNNQYLNGIYEDYDKIDKIKKDKGKKENTNNIHLLKNILIKNRHKNISPLSKATINSQLPTDNNSINLSQGNNISAVINKLCPQKIKSKINLKSVFNSPESKKILLRKIRSLSKEHKNNINNFSFTNTYKNKEDFGITQYISKNKIKNQRKIKIKNEIKKELINSYNNKLHFKAAEEIAENEANGKNKYLFLLPNLFKKNRSKEKEKIFKYDNEDDDKTNQEEDECYNSFYYKNPFNDVKKEEKYNKNIMKKLSKMAFEKDKNQQFFEFQRKKSENINQTFDTGIKKANIKDENEVEIDGEIFEKSTQFNLITKKVLQICKVYPYTIKKKKFPKAGDGKNMMTKGLSVNKFVKKYKLKY